MLKEYVIFTLERNGYWKMPRFPSLFSDGFFNLIN